jgi:hypothetical protein
MSLILSPSVGNSVCAFVHGFEPYFYVEAPTAAFSPDDCTSLVETLNVRYLSLFHFWPHVLPCLLRHWGISTSG